MPSPTISVYYRAALEDLKGEVESTPDDRAIGIEPEEWIESLVKKWGMEEIVLDDSRNQEIIEVESEHHLRGYNIYTDQGPGTPIRSTAVRVQVPVIPSNTIEVIWTQRLSPNTFSYATTYPEFDYDHSQGYFSDTVQPDRSAVTNSIERIKASVRAYNESITSENPGFRQQVIQIVTSKRGRVQEQHNKLDALGAEVGIRVTKKTAATTRPTAPPTEAPAARTRQPPAKSYDTFLAHATEDKDAIARPLYEALTAAGVSVWFDEAVLELGDSLRQKIDEGLARCRYGIVILSPSFFKKRWARRELDGLVAKETASGEKAILPIWHELRQEDVAQHSPTLADRIAGRSDEGIPALVEKIQRVLNK